jgi:hypothetical protein
LGAIGRRAFFPSVPQTQTSRYVTGVNKTTNVATLTYDPWGGVRLDDALLLMERASAWTMAEEMAARGGVGRKKDWGEARPSPYWVESRSTERFMSQALSEQ